MTVLDQWLDRNAAYDRALRDLYTVIPKVGSRVTDAVRKAIAAEQAAKDRLPPDTRGLVVIMAEIGRGGMNGAVIAIEEARAQAHRRDRREPACGARTGIDRGPARRLRAERAVTCARPLPGAGAAVTLTATFRIGSPRRATAGGPPPEVWIPVQLRVVTDQPWDVPADLLVVPVAVAGRLRRRPRRARSPRRRRAPVARRLRRPERQALLDGVRVDRRAAGPAAPARVDRRPREARPRGRRPGRRHGRAPPRRPGGHAAWRSGCRRSPTPSVATPRRLPGWSPAASSRARTTRARSIATPSIRRCPCPTS